MKKILIAAVLLASVNSNAQTFQSLFDQLVYVNKQWLKQADADESLKHTPAARMNEQQLVQFHLGETEKLLRKRDVSDLPAELQQQRSKNLDILRKYLEQGIFPSNDMHLGRQPYFIDRNDTYCAVGYLMQQTGAEQTAKEIRDIQNFNYLFDIDHPRLLEWAASSGLSLSELALIQPAYANDRPATITEVHYNNTGTDVNEYIEFQQPVGLLIIPVTNVLFYNGTGTLYKTLPVSAMSVAIPDVRYYVFPAGESFADVGKVELRGAGNQLIEVFTYNETSISVITYGASTVTRNYNIGESESTPAGQSLTFCGVSLISGFPSLSLQASAATNGTVNP
jgi:hypothetical protein